MSDQHAWKNVVPEELSTCWYNFDAAAETVSSILKQGIYQVGEEEAMQILTYYGFQFPKRALARTSREAAEQAAADRVPGGDEDICPPTSCTRPTWAACA